MSYCCEQDDRRDAVRSMAGRNGLDYVEVLNDQVTLYVYMLGKLPPELSTKKPGLADYFLLTGGRRITGIHILSVTPVADPDPEKDDFLVLSLDKYGDFSTYTLGLSGVAEIDPRYSSVSFSFKIDCPSDLDCAASCGCEPPVLDEPQINYLAKDYASFNQLIFDRLALLVPGWTERHAPDLGMALVEVLAYTGDYLSYYQDAVATEAYLGTARQRISVRRHARLVDYVLHEGCNARAWVLVTVSGDVSLPANAVSFLTGLNDALPVRTPVLTWDKLDGASRASYEVFEPMVASADGKLHFYAAHNDLRFYTWGERACCLERGSTSATLRNPAGALQLKPGDVLIFEEVVSPTTGLTFDADPKRRCAVRLTSVRPSEDPVYLEASADGQPTLLLEIEWAAEDALPFSFCLSAIGPAPGCAYIDNVSIAHGNVILVDHGQTRPPEDLGHVPTLTGTATCDCVGKPSEVLLAAGKLHPKLASSPLTWSQPLLLNASATALTKQDERAATPQIDLTSRTAPHTDLLSSPKVMQKLSSFPAYRNFLVARTLRVLFKMGRSQWKPVLSSLSFSTQLSSEEHAALLDVLADDSWIPTYDLIESSPADAHFVVEVDSEGFAHLRFGDGELGLQPSAGMDFSAIYRIGNGTAGNVGAESISRLVLNGFSLNGVDIAVRNPMPASGGTDPEPVADAKMFAPTAFRQVLQRAITAEDYETLAGQSSKLQRASAAFTWTGSWYEADVAVDPIGTETADMALLTQVKTALQPYRRLGQDLHVTAARYVPIVLELEVCALPDYQRAHLKAALLSVFSNRRLPGGRTGFFYPDNLTFGDDLYLSRVVAVAQAVEGVECVTVKTLHRLFAPPKGELKNGVLPLANDEIAQLDNDPDYPEHGVLKIAVHGGR